MPAAATPAWPRCWAWDWSRSAIRTASASSSNGTTAQGGQGTYTLTNVPFNEGYRYVDWLLTVPLLLVETVAVLALTRAAAKPLLFKLVIASGLMAGGALVGLGLRCHFTSACPIMLSKLCWSLGAV